MSDAEQLQAAKDIITREKARMARRGARQDIWPCSSRQKDALVAFLKTELGCRVEVVNDSDGTFVLRYSW